MAINVQAFLKLLETLKTKHDDFSEELSKFKEDFSSDGMSSQDEGDILDILDEIEATDTGISDNLSTIQTVLDVMVSD